MPNDIDTQPVDAPTNESAEETTPTQAEAVPVIKHRKITTPRKKRTPRTIKPEPESIPVAQSIPVEPTEPDENLVADPRSDVAASLDAIYRDNAGRVPDLKTLEIKKSNPIKHVIVGLITVAVLALAAYSGWWYFAPGNNDTGENIELAISAPGEIQLGEPIDLTITYDNREPVTIRNAVLEMYYPEGFVVTAASLPPANAGKTEWLLGTVPPLTKRTLTISGLLYAAAGTPGTVRALLSYRPENFTSTFQKNARTTVGVNESAVSLGLTGPSAITLGVPVSYTITVERSEALSRGTLTLEPNMQNGFRATSSSLPLDKNGRITLTSKTFATTTNSATVAITGIWSDAERQQAHFVVDTVFTPPSSTDSFVVATASSTATLTKNEVTASLAINGSTLGNPVHPGDTLAITLALGNNSKGTLHDGTIKLVAEGPAAGKQSAFDWANLTDSLEGTVVGEAVNKTTRRGTITWTAKEFPALKDIAAGKTVFIDIKLPLKTAQAFDWSGFSSTTFSLHPVADFTDDNKKSVHVESDPLALPLETDVALEVRDQSPTDQPLTHNISWVLTNNLHPLKDIQLTATVYGSVVFTPPTSTPAGSVTYDKKTKQITWKIGEMPSSVDVLALPFTITITEANPTQTTLVSKVTGSATDLVTGSSIDITGTAIDVGN